MTDLGYIGERHSLLIRQGADLDAIEVTLTYDDGTPVDLTGCTISGDVKKLPNAGPSASFTVSFGDQAAGNFSFALSAASTAALTCGPTLGDAASLYVWQLDLADAGGKVVPLYYGNASVFRDIAP